jgi:hypothetical protein
VPDELELIVRRCLAKRPQDRYAGGGELRKELEKTVPATAAHQ